MKLNIFLAILILTPIFLPFGAYSMDIKSPTYFEAERECRKGNPYACIVVQTATVGGLGDPKSVEYYRAQKKCLRSDNQACNFLKALSGRGNILIEAE